MNQFTDSIASFETAINMAETYLTQNTAPSPLHEMEREIQAITRMIGQAMLATRVAQCGTGEAGTHLDPKREWRYHGTRNLTYRSIFGPVPIRRAYYYHHRDEGGFCPLDVALAMPRRSYSYLLQEAVLKLSAHDAYDTGHQLLLDLLGVTVNKAIAEQMVAEAATDVPAFHAARPAPENEGSVLVIQADGKGIPMVRPATKETGPKMRRKKGEKRNKKKMATVFTLYTLDPEPGTEPKALNRKTYAFLTTKREAFRRIAAEVKKRAQGKKVLFLSDGDPDLAALASEFFPEAEPCVDWIHVVEYLWKAAYVFHKEGSPQAHAWVKAREQRLATDDVGTILRGLKQSLTKSQKLKASQRETLSTVIGYLEGVKDRIPYRAFLKAGYPIGTGSVEGACRHLICDRMERAGMHWKEPGAASMLQVRSVHINGEARDFNEFRLKREQERLYGRRACHAA